MIETGLKNKVVIVTGAAAGIGRATAERFVAEGCKVAAWDVNEAPESAGVFQKVNVADASEVDAAVAEVVDRWGPVSVLVNNAGIVRDAQLVKYKDGEVVARMTDDKWDAVIGVNLKGVFNCTRAVVPFDDRRRDRRRDPQRLVGGVSQRQLRPDQLRGHQGRRHRDDQDLGARTGQVRDPGQRGGAGIRQDRDHQRDAAEGHRDPWWRTRPWAGSATPGTSRKPTCGSLPMRRRGSPGQS